MYRYISKKEVKFIEGTQITIEKDGTENKLPEKLTNKRGLHPDYGNKMLQNF